MKRPVSASKYRAHVNLTASGVILVAQVAAVLLRLVSQKASPICKIRVFLEQFKSSGVDPVCYSKETFAPPPAML